MNKTVKTLLTIAVASLMLVACDKKEENAEKKASTIEEIQKEKGKPARVVKAATSKLTDVRKFSGTIQGINQNSAICKMGDPIAKINVQVGSSVQKDQVIAEYLFTGDNTQYQEAQEKIALREKTVERMRELHAKGGISQQEMDQQELELKIAKMGLETARRATLILAPEAGVVTEIKYKVGQTPGQGAQFATIAKLNKVILRSKHLLISGLQSASAVILEPPKIRALTVSIVSPSICHEVIGLDGMIFFLNVEF